MSARQSILVVDDVLDNLRLLSGILADKNYMVRPVPDGVLAISAAQAEPPDLILLDLMMPGMSGYKVCEQLKTDERTRDIPVIFLSAKNEVMDKVKAFSLGAVDYITKPFQAEEVVARVETHLTLRNLQRRLTEQNHLLSETLQQLKATQDQLIVQEKLASLGELVAGISHELKNPLNFICNFSQLIVDLLADLKEELEKPGPDPEELKYYWFKLPDITHKIKEHGDRAVRIIQGMLEHSRGEKGTRRPTNLNLLIKEYVTLAYHGMRGQDSNFNASIKTDYDPTLDVQKLAIVPQDISRVVLNLLSNAFQAVAAKAKVHTGNGYKPALSIHTKDRGDHIEIRIQDNGEGIPAEIRDRIFEPFFTTKPTGEGTGLGLSMSYEIITQEHQGRLWCKSEVGEYTEFIISLPKQENSDDELHLSY